MRLLLLLTLLLFGVAAVSSANDERVLAELQHTRALLQAEYALVSQGKLYLLFDLTEKQVQLKGGGLILEVWPIRDVRFWGPSPVPAAASLREKASFGEPERDVLLTDSGAPAEAGRLPKAFEVTDMPTRYRLHLDNGTVVSVRPHAEHWLTRLQSLGALPAWYLSRPLISGWNSIRRSPYNELALSMTAQDARMLYWVFSEHTPCLIRFPADVAARAQLSAGATRE